MRALALGLMFALVGAIAWAERWEGGGASPTGSLDRVTAELDAARRARTTIEERLAAREGDLATRVRALYKLTRAGLDPLWVDGQARADLVARRAAARRMVMRDLEERLVLTRELAAAAAAEERLGAELTAVAPETAQAIGVKLIRPVAGTTLERAGRHLDAQVGLERVREGVLYGSAVGAPVIAPLAATVLHVGPARGQGQVVVLERDGGVLVVVAGLAATTVTPGLRLERGALLGAAAGPVYLQLRVGGRPVDPQRFMEQRTAPAAAVSAPAPAPPIAP